eukprot:g47603.t1
MFRKIDIIYDIAFHLIGTATSFTPFTTNAKVNVAFQVSVVYLALPVFKAQKVLQVLLARMELRVFLDLLAVLEIQVLQVCRECQGKEELLGLRVLKEKEALEVKKDLKAVWVMKALEVCQVLLVHQ